MRLRRRRQPAAGADADGPAERSFRATYVLSDFLSEMRGRAAPVVIDLGPAIGTNVSFLGEEVACKLFIEDLLASGPGRSSGSANGDAGSNAWVPRLPHPDESVDGVLCWDVLDYLPRPAQNALAGQLVRILRPGGVLMICHRLEFEMHLERIVHEIVGRDRLRLQRGGDASAPLERPLKLRELQLMFGGLTALKTVLLKSRVREVLFRKAGPPAVSV